MPNFLTFQILLRHHFTCAYLYVESGDAMLLAKVGSLPLTSCSASAGRFNVLLVFIILGHIKWLAQRGHLIKSESQLKIICQIYNVVIQSWVQKHRTRKRQAQCHSQNILEKLLIFHAQGTEVLHQMVFQIMLPFPDAIPFILKTSHDIKFLNVHFSTFSLHILYICMFVHVCVQFHILLAFFF